MNCVDCESMQKHAIYEDASSVVRLTEHPAAMGEMIVLPKEHSPIIEKLSDDVFANLFVIANKAAVAAFDVFGAHGTNILINNGLAAGQKSGHTQIRVLPRFENDGLQLLWQPTKADEEDLNTIATMITAELEKKEIPKEDKKEEVKEAPKEEIADEDNYMLMQLERIP